MSGATTTELAPDAEARLGDYLRLVREALAHSPDVNPDEVEADIREHVENELHDRPRPVSRPELEAVLTRLGPPTQWLPAGRAEPPPGPSVWQFFGARWRAAREAVWRGPEDWRLPYLALGVFALSVSVFPPFLLVAYILGRAGIAVAREKGIELGAARKWMLYPPVVLMSFAFLLAFVIFPPVMTTIAVCGTAEDADRLERRELAGGSRSDARHLSNRQLAAKYPDATTTLDRVLTPFPGNRDMREGLGVLFLGAGAFTFWFAAVGLISSRFPGAMRCAFVPLCNGFGGKTARRVGLMSLMLSAAWGGVAYRLLLDAGLV